MLYLQTWCQRGCAGAACWQLSPPALAAHVMYTHIPQRHAPVLRVDLGIVADEHLEHIRLGAHHCVVDGAAPLRLVDCKGVGTLPQQILRAIRMPARSACPELQCITKQPHC